MGLTIADMTTASPISSLPLVEGDWALDTNHTSVGFTVSRFGLAKFRGRFGAVAAELVIGPSTDDCAVTATVAMASIDTGNPERDAHLRGAELLDLEQRPTMAFRSTKVRGEGSSWIVDGELAIGDQSRPLTLAVELGGVEDYLDGPRHVGFEATGEIRLQDFGLGTLGAMFGDLVQIDLDLEFIEPA